MSYHLRQEVGVLRDTCERNGIMPAVDVYVKPDSLYYRTTLDEYSSCKYILSEACSLKEVVMGFM